MPKATDIAWAAGIFDGEGCITITRQKAGSGGRINPSHRLYIKVTMGSEATVRRLREIFGLGTITLQKSERWNDAHTWWVASRQAGEVLDLMRPYLFTKLAEAELAREFLLIPNPDAGAGRPIPPFVVEERERLFKEMRDIKPSARFRAVA